MFLPASAVSTENKKRNVFPNIQSEGQCSYKWRKSGWVSVPKWMEYNQNVTEDDEKLHYFTATQNPLASQLYGLYSPYFSPSLVSLVCNTRIHKVTFFTCDDVKVPQPPPITVRTGSILISI